MPSQTFVDSPKSIGETRGDRPLCTDEVQELEDNSKANTSTGVEDQMGNTQLELADKVDNRSIVNPSLQEIRVEDIEKTNAQQHVQPTGGPIGTQEQHRITYGSVVESYGEKNFKEQ